MYEHISKCVRKGRKVYNFSAFFFALLQTLQIYRNIFHMLFSVMKSLYFTAGQFARLHQLNKRTLHYYDDIGLFSPAYKGENGYRYYTYQQSAQLENILAMRQLNMSIEEISSYLKHPNPQDFLEISQNKIQAIDQQIQQLQVLKQVFEQRQQSLARCAQIHDSQIEVESFAAHHYLLTPMPVEDNPMRNMQQIMQHLQSAWEHSSYKAGCGSYISLEKALQGQFDVYDGVFTPVDPQDDDSLFLLRPAGQYLCGYSVGSWDKLPELYSSMISYAKEHRLALTGNCYEIGLNEFAISRPEEYVARISILIDPKQ